ncbi:MAG: hypothetical protein AAGH71_04220 [Planctomycetota bacterium]
MSPAPGTKPAFGRPTLAALGLGILLCAVLTRAIVTYNPVPGWDADPFSQPLVATSLGPGGSAWLSWAMLVGSGLVLVGLRGSSDWLSLAALAGGVLVQVRALLLDSGDAEALATAGTWTAVWAILAAGRACGGLPRWRRFALACCLGLAGMLLAKAAVQILFEGPSVLTSFEANRDAILESRGMDPDGPSAAQYERRLSQLDPTAWFGLSNVLASVLAAGAAGLALALWRARRRVPIGWLAAGFGGLAACIAGVLVTGSKAGPLILCVSTGAGLVASRLSRPIAWAALLGAVALPTAAVVARGVLGVPETERSLLFRWFYMVGGVDVVASNAIEGTGPSGFRQAYVLAKPPTAPESVTSTHHALLDWIAMLGVAGWAWAAVSVGCCFVIARSLATPSPGAFASGLRRTVVLRLGLIAMVPTVANAAIEVDATTIELALGRIVGLAAWVGLAAVVWRLRPGRHAYGVIGLSLVMAAQFDMVLFIHTAAPLVMLLIGLAIPVRRRAGPIRQTGTYVLLGGLAALLAWNAAGLLRYERAMVRSAQAAQRVYALTEQLDSTVVTPADRRLVGDAVRDAAEQAVSLLRPMVARFPADSAASKALIQAMLSAGEARARSGETGPASGWFSDAIAEAERLTETRADASGFAGLSAVLERVAVSAAEPGLFDRAAAASTRAGELDPTNPLHPYRAARLLLAAGKGEQAGTLARRAIELDEAMRLDPLAGLTDRMRAEAQTWAGLDR